jgi:sugar transferase EpsL
MNKKSIQRAIKRLIDIVIAGTVLLVAAPVMGAVALLIRRRMGSPVIFRQQRPGLNEQPFFLCKFRTMNDARDASGELLPDSQRLTALGRFLRRTSLDELPQLWNVLRGDMSLVGPRPLLMAYLKRYTPEQARRHNVTPGITGWAQINGRNAISWEKKFELDVWYADHWSLRLDLRILLTTVWKVMRRDGINSASCPTMFEFRGSHEGKMARESQ